MLKNTLELYGHKLPASDGQIGHVEDIYLDDKTWGIRYLVVDGLLDGSLGFGGKESVGASFLRRDGTVWTTNKDGFIPCLLAAEITARTSRNPGEIYRGLTEEFDVHFYDTVEATATPLLKASLANLSVEQITLTELAGEKTTAVRARAPGNEASLGGIKVETANRWFAARPFGTDDIYKIYAESIRDEAHLRKILAQAQTIVDAALTVAPSPVNSKS